MNTAPLLDTHAWIWWVHGDERLGRDALRSLDDLSPEDRPAISDISLWEVATLVARGRLHLDVTLARWLEFAASPRTVRVLPISPSVAIELSRLGDMIHRDPADRLIIAVSRAHGLPVLTRDEAIIKSGLVKLWKPRRSNTINYAGRLPRLFELKDALEDPAHVDAYFQDFETKLANRHVFDQYERLERYLGALDAESWGDFRNRAARKLIARQRQQGRGWQDLFDVLNEAIGYAYLVARGATDIQFLPEGSVKTPDLAASMGQTPLLCEVKTVNKSQDQAERDRRVTAGEIFVTDALTELPQNWLATLRDKIASALEQLNGYDTKQATLVVFIAINFDDRIGDYHDRYFMQIDNFLDSIDLAGAELVLYPTTNAFERSYVMRNATVYLG